MSRALLIINQQIFFLPLGIFSFLYCGALMKKKTTRAPIISPLPPRTSRQPSSGHRATERKKKKEEECASQNSHCLNVEKYVRSNGYMMEKIQTSRHFQQREKRDKCVPHKKEEGSARCSHALEVNKNILCHRQMLASIII